MRYACAVFFNCLRTTAERDIIRQISYVFL